MALTPKYLTYGLYVVIPLALANDDIGQRLLQNLQQSQSLQEQRLLAPALAQPETADGGIAPIVIDGQAYAIAATVSEVGQALYVAVSRQQWPDVARLLPIYAGLPEHDVSLLWFAQATWARAQGHYGEAVAKYRAMLVQQPDFLRAQLELARTLFEDQQNQEARALFASIAPEALSEGLSLTIATYYKALDNREAWHGSLSFGPQYNNNLNQTSQIDRCVDRDAASGFCFVGFEAEQKIHSGGTVYEATLSKQRQLKGHHGLMFRGVAYGNLYWGESNFGEDNALVYGGYQYRDAATSVALLPFYEFNRYGGHAISRAYGLRTEWQQRLSPRSNVNLDLEHKQQSYVNAYQHNDGKQQSAFVTMTHALTPELVFFGGVDGLRKKTASPVNSHQQFGLRLGLYQAITPKLSASMYTSFRYRRYQGFNAFLGAQRKEHEQAYNVVLQWPQQQLWGFSPSLNLKHTQVNSNADYVYNYKKNEFSLRLNKYF